VHLGIASVVAFRCRKGEFHYRAYISQGQEWNFPIGGCPRSVLTYILYDSSLLKTERGQMKYDYCA
jgi:hypothetical protein